MGIGDDNNGNNNSIFFNDKHKNNYDANSRIMVTAIISLSFVVLLVTLLHVYARCVIRRQARRQEALRSLGLFRHTAIVHTTDPPKTGLDPSVISSLPVFVFKQTQGNFLECSVCLCGLEDGERIRILPNCKHSFHVDCIDKWLGSNSTCPVCRTEAEPRLVAEQREGVVVVNTGAPPSAPLFEGTSDGSGAGAQSLAKVNSESSSRLSSFRRILSRERSSRRIQNHHQSCGQDEGFSDLERQ